MVIALSMGELLLKVGVIEVKVEKNLLHMNMCNTKNSSICSDFGSVEDVWKGPLCCLSYRN